MASAAGGSSKAAMNRKLALAKVQKLKDPRLCRNLNSVSAKANLQCGWRHPVFVAAHVETPIAMPATRGGIITG